MSEASILDIKVLIASSQPDLVRELELLLAESFPIQVMGTVPDGRACIDRAVAWRPDILLIDEAIGVVPALHLDRPRSSSVGDPALSYCNKRWSRARAMC